MKTNTETVGDHAGKMTGVSLDTDGKAASISYTNIGDILTGVQDNGDAYEYAAGLKNDVGSFAGELNAAAAAHAAADSAAAAKIHAGGGNGR